MTEPKRKKPIPVPEKDDPGRMSEAEENIIDAKDMAAWEASARNIIECGDVLRLFAKEIGSDLAGESLNAKLLYIIGTSRLFDKTMHAAIKGTSSGGKSLLRQQVLRFFPEEDVVSFTTLSEKALLYYKDDFAHKILSMGEAAGAEEQTLQDYLLRELISEGRLHYPVVQKVEGQLVTVTIEKNGPVAFMVTTTKNSLHPENETRLLSLEINDTEDQTRAVLKKVAQVEGLNKGRADRNYDAWRDFQRWLAAGEKRVVVPFADELAVEIPAKSVRLRRDFGQVLRAIKAHALIHRKHRETDSDGQIVADIAHDYAAVRNLMNALIAESSGVAINAATQETVNAVRAATKNMAETEGVSGQAVALALKLDKSAARRRLVKAAAEGFVQNLETRRGQPGRYRATGQEPEKVDMLPSPETLATVPPLPKTQEFANTKQNGSGGTVARVAEEQGEQEQESDAEQHSNPAEPEPYADLRTPTFLCRACDGKGCPHCKPEAHGLPPRRSAAA